MQDINATTVWSCSAAESSKLDGLDLCRKRSLGSDEGTQLAEHHRTATTPRAGAEGDKGEPLGRDVQNDKAGLSCNLCLVRRTVEQAVEAMLLGNNAGLEQRCALSPHVLFTVPVSEPSFRQPQTGEASSMTHSGPVWSGEGLKR